MQRSTPAFLQPVLLCRPALPVDTPGVLEMSGLIWEGEDYLHLVWQDWLDDPEGLLVVGDYAGQIAATAKLTSLGEATWWLEGMRVHPDFEGRGFASHVFEFLLDACARLGGGTARLATSSKREAVHRMCARLGFTRVGDVSAFRASTTALEPVAPWPFTPLKVEEAAQAVAMAVNSTSRAVTGPFMDLGWQWQEPAVDKLAEAAAQGHAWWWRERAGLLAVWVDEEDEERTFSLQLAACPVEDLTALLVDFRSLGQQMGFPEVRLMLPVDAGTVQVLEQAGYHRTWDNSLFIYEKNVPVV